MKHVLSLILATLTFHPSLAQIFDSEQSHPSVRWLEIDAENYRLVFPAEFEGAARHLCGELGFFIQKTRADLGVSPPKITLILRGNHLEQNGYVQLAPRKSEMYPVPSSTANNTAWLSNLALHELRHVAQFEKLTGRLKGPFFEQLAFAIFGLNLPAWYFEGDAVQVETLFSRGGRGRLPSWEMPLRANALSGRDYGLHKYVHGSFRDIVPSYYTIGYFMNTHLTNGFGHESHERIMAEMRGKLLRPYNFQRALRKVSGLGSKGLFAAAMADLTEKWKREKPTGDSLSSLVPTKKDRYPSSYLLPQTDSAGIVYALKHSPQGVNAIIAIDSSGRERAIIKTGRQLTPGFHLRGDKIVWDEFRKDARFGKQTYNVVNIYDLSSGKSQTLTRKTRFYSPALHPFSDEIALVEVDRSNRSRLLIIGSDDGRLLDSIPVPEKTHVQQPRYDETGSKIIAIAVGELGTTLMEFDLADKSHHARLPWGNQQLERPSYRGENILFKANYDGLDNIYELDGAGNVRQLTDVPFGAFNPSIAADGQLLYNDYRHNGYKIAKTPVIPRGGTPTARPFYIEETLKQFPSDSLVPLYTARNLPAKPYRPAAHLVHFHSLSISGTDFESFDNYVPGVFWLSNDLMNTTQIKLGYEHDTEIAKNRYSAEVSYRKYLPVFTAKYTNRGMVGNAIGADRNTIMMFNYREHHSTFDIALPFTVYRRHRAYSFGFNFGTSYTRRYDVDLPLQNFSPRIAFPLNYQIYLNRNALLAQMDLQPRWGQNLSVTYRHLPFERTLSGSLLSARANVYFPGLFANHGIQLRAAAQKSADLYRNSYDIPMVSGWGHFLSPRVANTVMANYRMPISYPDWAIGSLAYVKRFQGLLFADFQNVHRKTAPKSFGIGLSADLNLFRYVQPNFNISAKLTRINDRTASQKLIPSFGWSYSY